jgi:hypothetical protein
MSERLPVIYIAGPYRAPTPWQILQNIRAAQAVALQVWKLGAVAICPHANTALFDGEAPDDLWLDGDLELLYRCDALLCTEDYQRSSGARAEVRKATEWSKPIFTNVNHEAFPRWIHGWKIARRSEAQ